MYFLPSVRSPSVRPSMEAKRHPQGNGYCFLVYVENTLFPDLW